MTARIDIDANSGFCFGVTTAIKKAEEELQKDGHLYCLGDIVHNNKEMERLREMGLVTIDHDEFARLHDAKVLLRAHGEPPSTYRIARENNLEIIDATCPVVLKLQRRIKQEHTGKTGDKHKQIVIYGKRGHAEVMGLVGQTDGEAIVIESTEEADNLDYGHDICLYSQTTKSLAGFNAVTDHIRERMHEGTIFKSYDTICRQVANRMPDISRFAAGHDLIVFVSGKKSSNGKMLYDECRKVNANTIFIEDIDEIDGNRLQNCSSIGICGATSTPKWLMENVMKKIESILKAKESQK